MTQHEAKFLLDHPDIAREFAENGTQNLEYADTHLPDWTWKPSTSPVFDCKQFAYRIRPQPKLRPWTPDEVPDCWIRRKDLPAVRSRVIAIFDGPPVEVQIHFGGVFSLPQIVSLGTLAENYEYQSDDGKWLPCGNYDVR